MIASLAGTLAVKNSHEAIVEVGGIGYRLAMSAHSISKLGPVGSDVFLYTHMLVRENEISLVGFYDDEERIAFLALIEVSGIGPKVALTALSTLPPRQLAYAVASDDLVLLSTIPGVGKKTASRLLLDLKGKLGGIENTVGFSGGTDGLLAESGEVLPAALADAHAALSAMGFAPSEIARACSGADITDDAGAIIKYALARIGRG